MGFSKNGHFRNITLRALKKQLRSLPDIQVPVELENRLLVKIMNSEDMAKDNQFGDFQLRWNLGAVAAVIFLLLMMSLIMLFNLSVTEITGKSLPYDTDLIYPIRNVYRSPFDHNLAFIKDINFVNGFDL
jgi:hypothetical protein